MVRKGDIRMKTLPFTENELNKLIEHAIKNYYLIYAKIKEVHNGYMQEETRPQIQELYFNTLNRLHQQAMIYSNQVRKYCGMKKVMYSE